MKMDHKIISGRQESRLFFSCYLVEDPANLHRLSDLEKAATHPIFSRLIQFKLQSYSYDRRIVTLHVFSRKTCLGTINFTIYYILPFH